MADKAKNYGDAFKDEADADDNTEENNSTPGSGTMASKFKSRMPMKPSPDNMSAVRKMALKRRMAKMKGK